MCCMEEVGLDLLGFVVIDYVILIWGLELLCDFVLLLVFEGLWDGLDVWFVGNVVMK